MSTAIASNPPQTVGVDGENDPTGKPEDPFASETTQEQRRHSHRFSAFDTQLFALNHPASSPSQAKRALEAHLAETDRRLEEASQLGTALVQQRKDLSERLKEVEKQQGEREIGPELRQKLAEVEKEYNELGRDSARAFLPPKARLQSLDDTNGFSAVCLTFVLQPQHTNTLSRTQAAQPSSRAKLRILPLK